MNYNQGNPIKSFFQIGSQDYMNLLSESIKEEIEGKGKEYILGVDEEEYNNYLINKYTLEPLFVDRESETISEPYISREWLENGFRQKYEADVYHFTVKYQFTGSSVVFMMRPSTFTMTNTEIYVNDQTNTVSFSFKLYKKDPTEFKRVKNEFYHSAFANLNNANAEVQMWNNGIVRTVNSLFQTQKNKYQQENDFFAAINVKVNKDTMSVFTAPTVKKKVIPQPTVSKNKEFSSEPVMSKEMYDDILKVIYDSGKNMEKKPALYKGKDEEGLRDQFLFVLETRYEGTTATGETFNRGGKTDIILKYSKDASNLFVAECKFWHGGSEFLKAISQLFDRYLTWRDSKAALIMFVTNKDFTSVLQTIKNEINNHPYFVKEVGKRGETSFSYIFHLPQDKDKIVYFEILAFHYDK